MCLLVVSFRCDPGRPLVVAANRDERYDRPASPVQVLAEAPAVLGGRDDEAGGTWLAVNEHGVVAGLTNQPAPHGRDPTKRTRGELPLLAARHATAAGAVDALADLDASAYNACSVLVGDPRELFSVELDGEHRGRVTALRPGRYVLENRPLGVPTAKTAYVAGRLDGLCSGAASAPGGFGDGLAGLLADHTVPPPLPGGGDDRPPALRSACVHADRYGTRSAIVVTVRGGPGDPGRLPEVRAADGPPCTTPFVDRSAAWVERRA